jgi:ubiquinone/menaquinone biosynthesis C-methylase UbiE
VLPEDLKGKRVLEIGLGFGTLGNLIALRNCDYFGLDIAAGPAKMMRYRLELLDSERFGSSGQGSALALPFANNYFDYVYTIGCLHHTGNLSRAVQEVHRVLKPDGKAVVMLYNRHSLRQLVQVSWIQLCDRLIFGKEQRDVQTRVRAIYDSDSTGEAAPYTEYVSRAQVQYVFRDFSNIKIDIQNFDEYAFAHGLIIFRRKWFLNNLARVLGLDLYIRAVK